MTIYRGLSGVNREVKQQYRGLSAVNRTIREQYRGLSGVNRKVFVGKPLGALYWEGDECTALTGGWVLRGTTGASVVTKYPDHLYFLGINRYGLWFGVASINLNASGFTKLYVDLSCTVTAGKDNGLMIKINTWEPTLVYSTMARGVVMVDITSISSITELSFWTNTNTSNVEANIYKIWLE